MSHSRKGPGEIITAATITVLFVVILILVVFAARGYQFSAERQEDSGNMRAVVSYVANCVRDNNTAEVTVEERSGYECLILTSADGYEQRFYLADGSLLEEYAEPGAELRPEDALEIGKTDEFSIRMGDNGLIEITTGEGTSYVNANRH